MSNLVQTIRDSKQKKDNHRKGPSVKDIMTAPSKDHVRVNVDGKYSHYFRLNNSKKGKK